MNRNVGLKTQQDQMTEVKNAGAKMRKLKPEHKRRADDYVT